MLEVEPLKVDFNLWKQKEELRKQEVEAFMQASSDKLFEELKVVQQELF